LYNLRNLPRRLGIPVGLALLLTGPFCFARVGDTDAGWHLALGRLIARSGLPHTNALTWTARDVPWYDTSWLWDAATYALTARFGLIALQICTLLVFALTLLAAAIAGQKVHRHGAWLAIPLALLLFPRLTVRPHVATWAGVAIVLALCICGHNKSAKWRFACAPVIAFFGNLHSGAPFAAGLLGLFCLEEWVRTRDAKEFFAALLGGLALLANPGFLFNVTSLFWHLLHVQQTVVIEEYLPPTLSREPLFFALLPLAIWLGWRSRREHPALFGAVVLFGVLGLRANRMVYEFSIVALPVFALHLPQRLGGWAVALAALACGASHRFDRSVQNLRIARDWDPAKLPVETVAFARAHGLGERLFNAYDWGGYVEWAQLPAFVDGRVQCFPPDFFPRFYQAGHSPQAFAEFLAQWQVESAITSRFNPFLGGRGMFDPKEWALLDWDAVSELYVKRADHDTSLEYGVFRPTLTTIARLGDADLRALIAETKRFEKDHPGVAHARETRCLVQKKLGEPCSE
jgi:hypothetical protein